MAQKPIDKRSRLNTREHLWQVMLALKSFTVKDVARETLYHASTVGDYLNCLAAAGIIQKEMTEPTRGIISVARYTIDPETAPAEPPRVRADGSIVTQGMGRHNMWRTMKMMKEFTVAQLVAFASTEVVTIALLEAEYYCDYLSKAGYISAVTGSSPRAYRFNADRYTGPKPPMIQRVLNVFDQNTGRVVWHSGKGGAQ